MSSPFVVNPYSVILALVLQDRVAINKELLTRGVYQRAKDCQNW